MLFNNIKSYTLTDREKLLTDYLKHSEDALELIQGQGFTFLDSNFIWQIQVLQNQSFYKIE